MRIAIITLVLAIFLGTSPLMARGAAASDRVAIVAVIGDVLAAYSSRDRDRFASYFESDAVIVDDLPPYAWTGAGSAKRWFWPSWAGSSGGRFTARPPSYAVIAGDHAYFVVPVDGYSKNDDGTRSTYMFHLAFGLYRHRGVWKVHAMANALEVLKTTK